MPKFKIETKAPEVYRIPENIPETPKFRTIVADPPWTRGQGGKLGAISKYNLMSLDRIKNMPVNDLAAENCTLWLWTTNASLIDALEVIEAWGFTYRGYYVWCKSKLGLGSVYLRNSTELCLVATKGKVKFKNHSQMNWGIMPTGIHSEKPRSMAAIYELMYDDPALELFCRRRPMSSDNYHWRCWGNETEGGADIFIPGYPVPKYSFETTTDDNVSYDNNSSENAASDSASTYGSDNFEDSDDGNKAIQKEGA